MQRGAARTFAGDCTRPPLPSSKPPIHPVSRGEKEEEDEEQARWFSYFTRARIFFRQIFFRPLPRGKFSNPAESPGKVFPFKSSRFPDSRDFPRRKPLANEHRSLKSGEGKRKQKRERVCWRVHRIRLHFRRCRDSQSFSFCLRSWFLRHANSSFFSEQCLGDFRFF